MNERITKIKNDISVFWKSRTKMQKGTMIGSTLAVILIAAVITYFATRTTLFLFILMLSPSEIGRIKETLDAQGVPNEIAPGGTSILVPEEQVDTLLVQLAAEGFPESGRLTTAFSLKMQDLV